MIRTFLCLVILAWGTAASYAQSGLTLLIKDHTTKETIPGVNIRQKGSDAAMSTGANGAAKFSNLPAGAVTFQFSYTGYHSFERTFSFPADNGKTIEIFMEEEHEGLEEVIIRSTRTSRSIANVPTRVETIEMEEIDEKNNMRPGNVAMLLNESTGIRIQQTSATSGNSSIRLQGLDGRYTQLLKDGFSTFGNFSSGLSVLEIPPLDLKQVEIIKGPASPLYGGGAIAGVINFISRTPGEEPVIDILLNQSHIGQSNAGAFLSGRGGKLGYTLLGMYNRSGAYDVDDDDFTEVPLSDEVIFHPKLFFYPGGNTTLQLGNSLTRSTRKGGDILFIKNGASAGHSYFERNATWRNVSTLELDHKLDTANSLNFRQSFSYFDRGIGVPGYTFAGREYTSFSDFSYLRSGARHSLVLGGTYTYSRFRERGNLDRDNRNSSGGLYAQHTLDASERIKIETGLRADRVQYDNNLFKRTEYFLLPRISVLVNYSDRLSSRFGGGLGYKSPTLFTEQTETMQYRNIAQLNGVRSERSYGATADLNWRAPVSDDLLFTLNHMFFYTYLKDPLVLSANGSGGFAFANAGDAIHTRGFETNARLIFREDFKLFLGFTFNDTRAAYLNNRYLPLVPRTKLNNALIYEKHGVIKMGLEGYFTGRQRLSDGREVPGYNVYGFMAEKIFRKFSVFVNFENFTDTRQSKFSPVAKGPVTDPVFDEIWTHTEGFVVNGGIKLKLGK